MQQLIEFGSGDVNHDDEIGKTTQNNSQSKFKDIINS